MIRITIILLTFVLQFAPIFSQLTYVPDDDFEEYIETIIPNASDGIANNNYVVTSALKKADNLLINFSNGFEVSDLTGIEDFDTLMNIEFKGQLTTEIDLSHIVIDAYKGGTCTIMQNNNLELVKLPKGEMSSIIIQNNPTLNVVDFSPYSNLYNVYLANNIILDSIDLSIVPELQSGGQLSITENAMLSYCNLKNGFSTYWGNVLVAENPNLYCIIVDDSNYAGISASWFWSERDGFTDIYKYVTSVSDCPSPLSLDESQLVNPETVTLKTYDLLGREIRRPSIGQIIIEINSDGSRVKKVVAGN